MKIYCFGNEYVPQDSIAKKIAESLFIPGIEFIKTDSLEGISGDIVILDAVKGIRDVKIIEDIAQIKEFYPISAHDFDLGSELKLRKAVGEIGSVKIIGIPMEGDVEKIKAEVAKFINKIRL
ncbi:hypothetical protein JW851_00925 [Candidatus Woesearchaeota archaeon]|nr:hypothetical protein [Candidatus Woesearchaeota archaeon]